MQNIFFHALVSFEILNYVAFYNVLFQTSLKNIRNPF